MTNLLVENFPERYLSEIAQSRSHEAQRLLTRLRNQQQQIEDLGENLERLDHAYEQLQEQYRKALAENKALTRQLNELNIDRMRELRHADDLKRQLSQAVEHNSRVLDLYTSEHRKASEFEGKCAEQSSKMSRLEAHLAKLADAQTTDRTSLVLNDAVAFPVVLEEWFVAPGQYFDKGQPLCRTNRGPFSWGIAGIMERTYTEPGGTVLKVGDAMAGVIVLER